MAWTAALPLFSLSLAVTLLSARTFARRLDRLGSRFGFPEALVGLLTALAADGPEISSALFALAKGKHGVGVGVLVGSNAFNLAAMIGLSAVLTGSVRLGRDTLALEGAVGVAVTGIGAALLLGWISPAAATLLSICVLVPYLAIVIGGGSHVAAQLARRPDTGRAHEEAEGDPTHHLLALVVLDVALIVAGSAGMVQSALALAGHLHISNAILGMLILAPLTSLPNAATAVRLGLAGRGAALVGETFNSNTLNLAAGVIVPSLLVAFPMLSATARIQLAWLVGMTCVCPLLLVRPRGMGRTQGTALIALYGGFVALTLASA